MTRPLSPRWCSSCHRPLNLGSDIKSHNLGCAERGERSYRAGRSDAQYLADVAASKHRAFRLAKYDDEGMVIMPSFSGRSGRRVA